MNGMRSSDVVIVGGGIGGSALATALARDGLDVVVLEASRVYEDRVRGESMLPWGVREARELGVEQTLLEAGAHVAPAWNHYDADIPVEVTEANPIPVSMMCPEVDGSMNLRHPDACNALNAAAVAAGAEVHRGVSDITLTPGASPRVRCNDAEGRPTDFGARMVVGADGRNSTVRRQAGIPLMREDETSMIAGLLIEGLDGVPDERDFLASQDDLFMAAFHQGGGRLRLYLVPGLAQKHRFSGSAGLDEFRRSARFGCLPFGAALADAKPAGPLATYPGDDSWTEQPFTDGVVLVGDAAGFNNPIIGEGLSITMRDARTVRDVLRESDWSPAAFAPYAEERMERMRRLREAAMFMSATFANDCDNRAERRARFFDLQQNEPLLLAMMVAAMGGPEVGPPEAFDGRLRAAMQAG
jgi:2-polyprenyl-6-methoxyphenol hydroxylase-like FAD-dependent oxidoreductase